MTDPIVIVLAVACIAVIIFGVKYIRKSENRIKTLKKQLADAVEENKSINLKNECH